MNRKKTLKFQIQRVMKINIFNNHFLHKEKKKTRKKQ